MIRYLILVLISTGNPPSVNNKSAYQSQFFNGIYGIWWGGSGTECEKWYISGISKQGKCKGIGYVKTKPNITGDCIENTSWNWEYWDSYAQIWKEAGDGLGVKCIN